MDYENSILETTLDVIFFTTFKIVNFLIKSPKTHNLHKE